MAKAFILGLVAMFCLIGCSSEKAPEPDTTAPTTKASPPPGRNTAPASFKGDMPQTGQAVPNAASNNGMPTSGELSVNPNAKK